MKKTWTRLTAGLLCIGALATLAACGGKNKKFSDLKLKDGTYQGHYQDEEPGQAAAVDVTITIAGGKITACDSVEMMVEGQAVKDEHYGEGSGEQNYKKAQIALEGIRAYPARLVDVQDPEKVDAMAGATISLKRFKSAVWQALDQASGR